MNPLLVRARLFLVAASALFLVGGVMFAVARWTNAEADRAFVEAAARAAALPASSALPPRYWAPTALARPGAIVTQRIEAVEQARTRPAAPPPSAAPAPDAKPPAAAP